MAVHGMSLWSLIFKMIIIHVNGLPFILGAKNQGSGMRVKEMGVCTKVVNIRWKATILMKFTIRRS